MSQTKPKNLTGESFSKIVKFSSCQGDIIDINNPSNDTVKNNLLLVVFTKTLPIVQKGTKNGHRHRDTLVAYSKVLTSDGTTMCKARTVFIGPSALFVHSKQLVHEDAVGISNVFVWRSGTLVTLVCSEESTLVWYCRKLKYNEAVESLLCFSLTPETNTDSRDLNELQKPPLKNNAEDDEVSFVDSTSAKSLAYKKMPDVSSSYSESLPDVVAKSSPVAIWKRSKKGTLCASIDSNCPSLRKVNRNPHSTFVVRKKKLDSQNLNNYAKNETTSNFFQKSNKVTRSISVIDPTSDSHVLENHKLKALNQPGSESPKIIAPPRKLSPESKSRSFYGANETSNKACSSVGVQTVPVCSEHLTSSYIGSVCCVMRQGCHYGCRHGCCVSQCSPCCTPHCCRVRTTCCGLMANSCCQVKNTISCSSQCCRNTCSYSFKEPEKPSRCSPKKRKQEIFHKTPSKKPCLMTNNTVLKAGVLQDNVENEKDKNLSVQSSQANRPILNDSTSRLTNSEYKNVPELNPGTSSENHTSKTRSRKNTRKAGDSPSRESNPTQNEGINQDNLNHTELYKTPTFVDIELQTNLVTSSSTDSNVRVDLEETLKGNESPFRLSNSTNNCLIIHINKQDVESDLSKLNSTSTNPTDYYTTETSSENTLIPELPVNETSLNKLQSEKSVCSQRKKYRRIVKKYFYLRCTNMLLKSITKYPMWSFTTIKIDIPFLSSLNSNTNFINCSEFQSIRKEILKISANESGIPLMLNNSTSVGCSKGSFKKLPVQSYKKANSYNSSLFSLVEQLNHLSDSSCNIFLTYQSSIDHSSVFQKLNGPLFDSLPFGGTFDKVILPEKYSFSKCAGVSLFQYFEQAGASMKKKVCGNEFIVPEVELPDSAKGGFEMESKALSLMGNDITNIPPQEECKIGTIEIADLPSKSEVKLEVNCNEIHPEIDESNSAPFWEQETTGNLDDINEVSSTDAIGMNLKQIFTDETKPDLSETAIEEHKLETTDKLDSPLETTINHSSPDTQETYFDSNMHALEENEDCDDDELTIVLEPCDGDLVHPLGKGSECIDVERNDCKAELDDKSKCIELISEDTLSSYHSLGVPYQESQLLSPRSGVKSESDFSSADFNDTIQGEQAYFEMLTRNSVVDINSSDDNDFPVGKMLVEAVFTNSCPILNRSRPFNIIFGVCRSQCKLMVPYEDVKFAERVLKECSACKNLEHLVCPTCAGNGLNNKMCLTFLVELTITDDGEHETNVLCLSPEADKFFGITVPDFLKDRINAMHIIQKLINLRYLGASSGVAVKDWVHLKLCLKVCHWDHAATPFIFNTVLDNCQFHPSS